MNWCVVLAEPNREQFARDKIAADGHEPWWPHYMAVARHARRERQVRRGLFPGYLFAAVPHPGLSRAIERCEGVASVVRAGQHTAWMPPRIMQELQGRALTPNGLFPPPDGINAHGRPGIAGQKVKISGGHTWAGFIAQVRNVIGSAVDLEITDPRWWGKPIRATVDLTQIELT